jgi:hypothetical protein
MLKGLLKLTTLGATAYVGYANLDAAKSATEAIRRFQTEMTSKVEMQNVARAMVAEYVSSETLPMEDFSGWMRENLRQAEGIDAAQKRDLACDVWGTPYHFRLDGPGFVLKSAGPDKAWKTEDDLQLPQSLECVDDRDKILANLSRQLAALQQKTASGPGRTGTTGQGQTAAPGRGVNRAR